MNDIFQRIDATLAKAATKDDLFRISAIGVVAAGASVFVAACAVVVAVHWLSS